MWNISALTIDLTSENVINVGFQKMVLNCKQRLTRLEIKFSKPKEKIEFF